MLTEFPLELFNGYGAQKKTTAWAKKLDDMCISQRDGQRQMVGLNNIAFAR